MSLTSASRPCQVLQRLRQGLHHVFQCPQAVSSQAFHFTFSLKPLASPGPRSTSHFHVEKSFDGLKGPPRSLRIRGVLGWRHYREAFSREHSRDNFEPYTSGETQFPSVPPPHAGGKDHLRPCPAPVPQGLRRPLLIRLHLYSAFKPQLP